MNKSITITGYKRTTDKQYSLLTHEMSRFSHENYTGKQAIRFWTVLTDKLNALGPPYRTVSQWKKVWTDYRRFHSRKAFKSQHKFAKPIKQEPGQNKEEVDRPDEEDEDTTQTGFKSTATGNSKIADYLRSESEEYEQSYESMHSTLSNDFADEYSYPDRVTNSLQGTQETLIPDEAPYDSLNYSQDDDEDEEQQLQQQEQFHERTKTHVINAHRSPPPLQPANTRLIDQTLYTLQNQIEQQSKLLEHLSQISSTMANLMERQVNAIEKQTEAIRRQASATEHHTLVMNNFVEMIRDKMPRVNSKTNVSNGSL